ncbi:MAG: DUF169 domain-containing protein [Methanolobus sp.]|nr:DUF169 domain-containing protein [Methanolobus sp.]
MRPGAYNNIEALIEEGCPVCITFSDEQGDSSDLLYCELTQRARYGGSFIIEHQRCKPGDYILGISEISPVDYYLRSGRYKDSATAQKAVFSLPRVIKTFRSIRIEPWPQKAEKFDVLLLYLKPEKAMRIIQAYAYQSGNAIPSRSIGAASICGDCTARPLTEAIGLSYGCKGSRKHSRYDNNEVPLGISYGLLEIIEEGLSNIPQTFD